MVYKCAAFGRKCFRFPLPDGRKPTLHSFPLNNKELCNKWIQAIPRANFVLSKHSRLCSRHFRESDFVEDHQDRNPTRCRQWKQTAISQKLQKRYLKPDSVPSFFDDVCSDLRTGEIAPQITQDSCLENSNESFIGEEIISGLTLVDIDHKLKTEATLPSGFTVTILHNALIAYILALQDDGIPKISGSITLRTDLTLTVSVNAAVILASQFCDLCANNQVQYLSQLVNLMARVKVWSEEPCSLPPETAVKMAGRSLGQMDDTKKGL